MATTKTAAKAPDSNAMLAALTTVPLADLRAGHTMKGGSVNARKTSSNAAGIKALVKSIGEMGLIVPLTIATKDGVPYVVDGNTRLAALHELHAKADKTAVMVPTFEPAIGMGTGDALELSMVANSERTDLHPVDRFEVFARLVAGGATVEWIGTRYMLKPAQVRQALGLARLAPELRQAWRDGKIDGEAAEAYAQTPDLEHQIRVFKKLKGRVDSWAINREIVGDDRQVGTLLRFVGRDAYEKAGHHINDSLFADDDEHNAQTVSNVPALKALAEKKLEEAADKLKSDGWGWVMFKDDAPRDIYAWRRSPPTPTKEVKAVAGCVVGIGHDGQVQIDRGYIKPGTSVTIPKSPAEKKAAAAKAQTRKDTGGGLSQSLCFRLSTGITLAAAEALQTDPKLALRVAVAAMACAGSPARIDLHGHDDKQMESRDDNEFADYFLVTSGKPVDWLLKTLATWTAASLQLVAHSPESMPLRDGPDGTVEMLNAIPAKALNAALRKHFDREDYFKSVSADLIRSALIDCGGLELAAGCSTMKKAGKIAYAIDKVSPGWLPPELRTKHYEGPAAAPAKAKAGAKAKAKKKVRR